MSIKHIFLIVVLISFSSAFAQEKSPAAKSADGPQIEFSETEFDFGTAPQETEVKHTFIFKNVGTDTLKISEVKTSCGCTAAESSKIILPQKNGQIDVVYTTGHSIGQVSKTVFIYSNSVDSPYSSVSIRGMVKGKTPKTNEGS